MKRVVIAAAIMMVVFCSCSKKADTNINRYIRWHCHFRGNEACTIDLREAFGIDYDTMFLFHEFTVPNAMKNCLNDTTFEPVTPFSPLAIEYNCHFLVLKKDNKIVLNAYKDNYGPRLEGGIPTDIQGIWDNQLITDKAMVFASPLFKVTKDYGEYTLENVSDKSIP